MNQNNADHRSVASSADDDEDEADSSYHDSDEEDYSTSSRSSVSYESGDEESSCDDESSSASNSSDESSSNHRSRNSGDSTSTTNDVRRNSSPSSLIIAATDSSIAVVAPSSSSTGVATTATTATTNRTFHRGVLPISISTNGHDGIGPINKNNVLTHRRRRREKLSSLEANDDDDDVLSRPQCRQDEDEQQHGGTIQDHDDDDSDHYDNHHHHHRRRHRKTSSQRTHRKHSNKQQWHGMTQFCINYICCQTQKRSTRILIAAFFVWLMAQFYYFYYYDLKDYYYLDLKNSKGLYDEFFGPTGGGKGQNDHSRSSSGGGYIEDEYFYDYSNVYKRKSLEEIARLRKERVKEARKVLGSAAIGDDDDEEEEEEVVFDNEGYIKDSGGRRREQINNNSRGGRRKKKKNKKSRDSEGSSKVERLKPGCSPLEWHSYHFPNCNEIHEIDLRAAVRHPRESFVRQRIIATTTSDGTNATDASAPPFPWGFVSNGLWRDVFSCDPREEVTSSIEAPISPMPPAVLKVMKREHEYDQRNFQRHRRDALVMERLSSSHHLVAIYGYCANTVLTQAISHTLDDVIYARENERKKIWNPRNGYQVKPPLESWMGKDDNGELLATRETELGRIRLALGVFRGLMDLHEGDGTTDMEWLPVIHADLQAKQYLVDSDTGKVYLNDFNRCRFIAKKDSPIPAANNVTLATNVGTHIQSCPVYIPTAPGYARSPEEYNNAPLTEKLDIYSAGNILYGIITGKKPWNGERGKHIKDDIQTGKRPEVDAAIRDAEGTVDAELVRLLDRVYEADPDERASAKEVVVALEQLLEKVLARYETGDRESIGSSNVAENE